MTIRQLSIQSNVQPKSVAKRAQRAGLSIGLNEELTPEQVQILSGGKKTKVATKVVASEKFGVAAKVATNTATKKATTLSDNSDRSWALWTALVLTLATSVPNMYAVSVAVKGSVAGAGALTAVATVAPLLLIYARVRRWEGWTAIALPMGYTAFCNGMAIYGGLTSMDKGYTVKPTVLLECATAFFNTPYEPTARFIAVLVAVVIGFLEFVTVKRLSK